jgi:hypothetical protein
MNSVNSNIVSRRRLRAARTLARLTQALASRIARSLNARGLMTATRRRALLGSIITRRPLPIRITFGQRLHESFRGRKRRRRRLPKLSLNLDGASDSIHGAGELHQCPVAHKLDDPSRVGGNRRINEPASQCIQTGKGPGLVQTHEARVPDYVGRQDCRKPPLEAFFGHADTLQEDPTIKSLWLTGRTVYRGPMRLL